MMMVICIKQHLSNVNVKQCFLRILAIVQNEFMKGNNGLQYITAFVSYSSM